ncbi:uncharacterized protein BKA78DRAFT_70176 [Phyllosticta capitalensis]|uniref:uncharacterized protein n=1 Tax=Phyllosticta capitalensis TaxID=121624 RepID=UPI00312FF232
MLHDCRECVRQSQRPRPRTKSIDSPWPIALDPPCTLACQRTIDERKSSAPVSLHLLHAPNTRALPHLPHAIPTDPQPAPHALPTEGPFLCRIHGSSILPHPHLPKLQRWSFAMNQLSRGRTRAKKLVSTKTQEREQWEREDGVISTEHVRVRRMAFSGSSSRRGASS